MPSTANLPRPKSTSWATGRHLSRAAISDRAACCPVLRFAQTDPDPTVIRISAIGPEPAEWLVIPILPVGKTKPASNHRCHYGVSHHRSTEVEHQKLCHTGNCAVRAQAHPAPEG